MKRVLSLEDLLGSTKLLKSGGSRGRGGGDSSGTQERSTWRQDLHRFCDSIRGCGEVERAVEQDPENWDKLTKLFESGGSCAGGSGDSSGTQEMQYLETRPALLL